MADEKNVVVSIGAVLQLSFRTAFRDANREATTLNRVLGQLGARRSNAGLSGVRDQATAATRAVTAFRTEGSKVGRALSTLQAHPHQNAEEIGRSAAHHVHDADRMAAADLRSSTMDWVG